MADSLNKIYDSFAKTYDENRGSFDISEILEKFRLQLPVQGGSLLDLGCGAGEPVASYFIKNGWHVTGVDFSEKMLELSTKYAPEMDGIKNDIREVDFQRSQFDTVTATYSLFHIPAEDHPHLFKKIYGWLKPGGRFLFTYATKEYTGEERFNGFKKFIDTELFYSHVTPDELFSDLSKIGFEIVSSDYHTIFNETFLWVTASKT